jgi:hypothetical protein
VFVVELCYRKGWLMVVTVLFREPVGEPDDWMNTLDVPVMLYGSYAAYKQKPVSTTVFTLASQVLNQWCMKVIVDHYEDVDSGHQGEAGEF